MAAAHSIHPLVVLFELQPYSDDAVADAAAIQTAVEQVVTDDPQRAAPLLNLVLQLEPYLTTGDDRTRQRAIKLLAQAVARYMQLQTLLQPSQPLLINDQSATVLVEFFCQRLSDQGCVGEVARGLLVLLEYKIAGGIVRKRHDDIIKIAKTIFSETNVQSHSQIVRGYFFKIFTIMVEEHITAIKKFETDFVFGFIQAMDGEKDPRNLILAFKIIQKILAELDFAKYTQDLFEVTSCYFPINFKPPQDDPYGITGEDLKLALRKCLSGTSAFGPLAMPLLLEKLSSHSVAAKKDALETLAACTKIYGENLIGKSLLEIWTNMRAEVVKPADFGVQKAALDCMRALFQLVGSISSPAEVWSQFLQKILEDCKENILTDDGSDGLQKTVDNASKIIAAVSSGSLFSRNIIVNEIVPIVLDLHDGYLDIKLQRTVKAQRPRPFRRRAYVDLLADFLAAISAESKEASGDEMDVDTHAGADGSTAIFAHLPRLLEVFLTSFIETANPASVRLSGIRAVVHLIHFLAKELETDLVCQHLVATALSDADVAVRDESAKSLALVGKEKPNLILGQLLPALPKAIGGTEQQTATALKLATQLAESNQLLFREIFQLLSNSLIAFILHGDTRLVRSLSEALKLSLIKQGNNSSEQIDFVASIAGRIFEHLVSFVVKSDDGGNGNQLAFFDCETVEHLSWTYYLAMKSADAAVQRAFANNIVDIMLCRSSKFPSFEPLTKPAEGHRVIFHIFSSVLVTLKPEASLSNITLTEFMDLLVKFILSSDFADFDSVSRIIGAFVNKMKGDDEISSYLTGNMEPRLSPLLQDANAVFDRRGRALNIWLWITRALVVRTHSLFPRFLSTALSFLEDPDPEFSRTAANSFVIVGGDTERVLNKSSFANVKLLYKQRLFNQCLPTLTSNFASKSELVKGNCLLALSSLLRSVPKQLLSPQMTLLTTLTTFLALESDIPTIFGDYINTLVPVVLRLSDVKTSPNMVLMRFTKLPHHLIFPQKISVVLALKKTLDDPKRVVRKEAVTCHNAWLTAVNTPNAASSGSKKESL